MKIHTVGLKELQTPITIKDKNNGQQQTIATVSLQAELAGGDEEHYLETFLAILGNYQKELSVASFSNLLKEMKNELGAKSIRLTMRFPYFVKKVAPVSRTSSLMDYEICFSGGVGDDKGFILGVSVPVTTLCPCSKEISEMGAHNQRAEVILQVKFKKFIWIEDLIRLIEESASCELFSLLKRPDEKYVTERAYNNPMFVEDVVRKVSLKAQNHPEITWFSASVESFEAIHNHSAYAYVDSDDA